jgi:signal transduction histidine kinase
VIAFGQGLLDAPVLQSKGRGSGYNVGHAVGRAVLALMWGVLVLPDVPDSPWIGLAVSMGLLSIVGDTVRFGIILVTLLVTYSSASDEYVSRAFVGGIVLAAGNILADVLRNDGYEDITARVQVSVGRRVLGLRVAWWNRWFDLGLLVVCGLWMWFQGQRAPEQRILIPSDRASVLSFVFGVVITAASVRAARSYAQAESEKEAQAASAVSGERTRIARELHDVVAHRLSGIVVQSQVARVASGVDAAQAVGAIEHESRAALDELRSLLGALRADAYAPSAGTEDSSGVEPPQERLDDATIARTITDPPPGIREIDAQVDGDLGHIPGAVGLQALRVLQESIANAARHAPGAVVHLVVLVEDRELRLSVTNGPGGPSAGGGTGVGLVGMRERAALVGGTLDAGPTDDGGWRVELTCPLRA